MSNFFRTEYRELSDIEKTRILEIKYAANGLLFHFSLSGESRELSIAKTKLEEAVMWAVKHITQ